MKNGNQSSNLMHFSKRLVDNLNSIFKMPLTIISAPIGYGKTTAIREYLKRTNTKVLWTTVYSSNTNEFWEMICKALSVVNSELSLKLLTIGFPYDKNTRLMMIKEFDGISFESETVLVIEDFNLANADEVAPFINYLAKKSFHNFHIVITTRNNLHIDDELHLGGYVNVITSSALSLDEVEVDRFFRRYEIFLSQEDIRSVMYYTEGWISALHTIALAALHSDNFDFNKLSCYDNELIASIMNLVYEPLPSILKQFLCCICYISDITLEQAEYLWMEFSDQKSARQMLDYLVDNNVFTVFDKTNNNYHIHNLLCKVIKNDFEHLEESLKLRYIRKMGDWYAKCNNSSIAISYYYQSGHYTGICNLLSASVTNIYNDSDVPMLAACYKAWRTRMLKGCYDSMFPLAVKMYLNNSLEIYEKILQDVKQIIDSDKVCSEESKDLLFAQYEILLCLSEESDLESIERHLRNAYKLCPKSYRVVPVLDWVFASPSVLLLYYQKTGTINKLLDKYRNAMDWYRLLTNYDITGMEHLIQAEVSFNKCQIDNAEIHLYCALRNSEKNKEHSLWIACCFLQARIYYIKGDIEQAFALLAEARKRVQLSGLEKTGAIIDLCESWLYLLSGQTKCVPDWVYHKGYIKKKVFKPVIPFVYILRDMLLISNARYTEFISYSIEKANSKTDILSLLYEKLFLSIAYKNIELLSESTHYLCEAIDCAIEDDLYMPFVELASWLFELYETVTEEEHIAFLAIIKEKTKSLKPTSYPGLIELTKREKEIADLVQNGLINKEIAKRLYISENTVKSALKLIFRKLGISSRKELITKNHP